MTTSNNALGTDKIAAVVDGTGGDVVAFGELSKELESGFCGAVAVTAGTEGSSTCDGTWKDDCTGVEDVLVGRADLSSLLGL